MLFLQLLDHSPRCALCLLQFAHPLGSRGANSPEPDLHPVTDCQTLQRPQSIQRQHHGSTKATLVLVHSSWAASAPVRLGKGEGERGNHREQTRTCSSTVQDEANLDVVQNSNQFNWHRTRVVGVDEQSATMPFLSQDQGVCWI